EKTTFESYVLQLRLERAKQMLTGTSLNVEGISGLCGFRNRVHFHRVIKRALGVTPIEYRARHHYRNRILEGPRTGRLLAHPATPNEELT
ncbi:MAG TPA: helix-turn-helix domain-containing protein, partial [Polyangiaceae bacterium]|nr:helix-turn-helix domain-containing protein [Polyangiaceae bacterium]